MSVLGSSTLTAVGPDKLASVEVAARVLVAAVQSNLTPRQISSRGNRLENAVAHRSWRRAARRTRFYTTSRLLRRPAFHGRLDDFERVRGKVPVLCDLKPSGRYVIVDFHRAGGTPQVLKMLLVNGVLNGACTTIEGRTLGECLEDVPESPPAGQDVIRPWSDPMYPEGHLAILKGNLAPRGCVAKITGLKTTSITGPARVFNSEGDCMAGHSGAND